MTWSGEHARLQAERILGYAAAAGGAALVSVRGGRIVLQHGAVGSASAFVEIACVAVTAPLTVKLKVAVAVALEQAQAK